jgi:hypothetical protein
MSKVTPRDFFDDSLRVSSTGKNGFLRLMHAHGNAGCGYWWTAEFVHPEGIVSVYRQADHTRLDFAFRGRLYIRTWEAYWGDRTISQIARQFVADVLASVDGRRMAETRSGSVRSTASAVRDSGDAQPQSSTGAGQ